MNVYLDSSPTNYKDSPETIEKILIKEENTKKEVDDVHPAFLSDLKD